ncbi:MAG: DUF1775 domain-containing protein [Thermoleophilia bacterium]
MVTRGLGSTLLLSVLLTLVPARAVAHVDVLPTEAVAGQAERFTIRVPSERDLDTIAVQVLFPEQVTVYSVNPPPGWDARLLYRPDRRTRGVVFRGGRIPDGQFEEFDVLGTPQEAGEVVWRSRQTYADGVVKPWTGPPEQPGETTPESGPGDPGPASAMTLRANAIEAGAEGPTAAPDADEGTSAAIWLGLIAIAISMGAAVGVGLLWSTRPARLPRDDE